MASPPSLRDPPSLDLDEVEDNDEGSSSPSMVLPVVSGSTMRPDGLDQPPAATVVTSPEEGGMLSRMLFSPTAMGMMGGAASGAAATPATAAAAASNTPHQLSDEEVARQLAYAEEGAHFGSGGGRASEGRGISMVDVYGSSAGDGRVLSMATSPLEHRPGLAPHLAQTGSASTDNDEDFAWQLAEQDTAFGGRGGGSVHSGGGGGGSGGGGGGGAAAKSDEELARRLQEQYDRDTALEGGFGGLAGASAGHDHNRAGGGLDFGLAMMLQQLELASGYGQEEEEVMVRELRFVDPVWGEYVVPEGTRPKLCDIVCFSCCPCCAGETCVKRGSSNGTAAAALTGNGAASNSNGTAVGAPEVMQRHAPSSSSSSSSSSPSSPSSSSSSCWGRLLSSGLCPYECAPVKVAVLQKLKRTMSCWLALVQVLMLAVSLILSEGFAPPSLNPMLGPWPTILNTLGAKNAALITYRGQLWRLFTPMLLHAGVIHLFINVVIQLRVGVLLELQWGLPTFCLVYVAGGLTSSILSCLILPNHLGVGSSGALMGLFGAWLVDLVIKWPAAGSGEDTSQRSSQLLVVFLNVVITMLFSFVPLVDWAAHFGGLVGGALIAFFLFGKDMNERFSERTKFVVRWLGLVAYVTFVATGLTIVLLYLEPDRFLLHVCKVYRDHLDDKNIPC